MNKMYSSYRLVRKFGLEVLKLKRDLKELMYIMDSGCKRKKVIRSKYMRLIKSVTSLSCKIRGMLLEFDNKLISYYSIEFKDFLKDLESIRYKLLTKEVIYALF